jgi:hypothetical protein
MSEMNIPPPSSASKSTLSKKLAEPGSKLIPLSASRSNLKMEAIYSSAMLGFLQLYGCTNQKLILLIGTAV